MLDREVIAYSPERAAELLGCCRGYVYTLMSEKRLEGRKLGRRTFILRDSLLRLLESAPVVEIHMSRRKAAA